MTAPISKASYTQAVKDADAQYKSDKDACSSLSGNAKDDRVAADTNKEAATKQAEARKDASADKRAAEYRVAIEKCDALAGPAKDTCVSSAKAQYGKP